MCISNQIWQEVVMVRVEAEGIGLLFLAVAVAISGWFWVERRAASSRALAYAAAAYPGAGVEVRRPAEAAECGVLLLQVDGRRWVMFDAVHGVERAAIDEDAVARVVRGKLRLADGVPVRVVDARNTAGTDGLFVAGVAVGEGLARSRWELGVDILGCRLVAVELTLRDQLTGEVIRHPVMKPLSPAVNQ